MGVCKWWNLPGTTRNTRNLPGTLKKAQMIKFKKKTNNKKEKVINHGLFL